MTASKGRLETAALIAEILGGVAVVVSVVYLALQISDNNRLLRSQSHYNALEIAQRPFETLIEDGPLAGALERCETAPDDVNSEDWKRCSTYYFMQANAWEYLYYQNRDGTIPPEFWDGSDNFFSGEAVNNPAWLRLWGEAADAFGEPFRSHMKQSIDANPGLRGREAE
jgi:hypothetical protein